MGELNFDDIPLPALFEKARKVHQSATESSDGVDQELLKKGCRALEKCDEMISKLGLFSTNESKEDISTTNLKYIMVPCYLGELTEKVEHEDRIQILKVSQAKLKRPETTAHSSSPSVEKLPDASLLFDSPDFSPNMLSSNNHFSHIAQSASHKRESSSYVSSIPCSKLPKSNLPHSKNVPDTVGGMLVPPQLSGRHLLENSPTAS